MMPACGPPSSLSPLKQTRSTPLTKHFGGCRLVFEARDRLGFDHRAAAEVLDEHDPPFRASAAMSSVSGDSTKPSMKKLLRCTFRISAVWRVMARA